MWLRDMLIAMFLIWIVVTIFASGISLIGIFVRFVQHLMQ